MFSAGKTRWRCNHCRIHVQKSWDINALITAQRRNRVKELAALGLTLRVITKLTGSDYRTVKAWLPDYQPGFCKCGRVANHTGGCSSRWRNRVANILLNNPRSEDEISLSIRNRISNALPVSLAPDVRQEIAQAMLLDISEAVNSVIKQAGSYVTRFYREQGAAAQHVYMDHEMGRYGRTSLSERLVG